jgi:predicted O-methyltransferase YrrM
LRELTDDSERRRGQSSVIDLRQIFARHLRGTPVGEVTRTAWRQLAPIVSQARLRLQEAGVFKYRASMVARYYWPRIKPAFRWMVDSRETSNFTYDLTEHNEAYLAEFLAVATGRATSELAAYIVELHADEALRQAVVTQVAALGRGGGYDPVARFGRRVGWYALARALKPRVVVETGVDKGLGALVLCAALLRNAQGGNPGRYYGTDIDVGAGRLLCEPYRSMGRILYGDSIESLQTLPPPVDFFINDSDHSAEYEAHEYRTIAPKLSECAVIIGDNSHVTDALLKFSRETDRRFLFFREEPANHWYPGAGIGLSFKSSRQSP